MSSTSRFGHVRSDLPEGRVQALSDKFDFTDGFLEPHEIRELFAEIDFLYNEQVEVELSVSDPNYQVVEFPDSLMSAYMAEAPRYGLKLTYKGARFSFRVLEHEGVAFTYEYTDR